MVLIMTTMLVGYYLYKLIFAGRVAIVMKLVIIFHLKKMRG